MMTMMDDTIKIKIHFYVSCIIKGKKSPTLISVRPYLYMCVPTTISAKRFRYSLIL
jgi:hypothetical protein